MHNTTYRDSYKLAFLGLFTFINKIRGDLDPPKIEFTYITGRNKIVYHIETVNGLKELL